MTSSPDLNTNPPIVNERLTFTTKLAYGAGDLGTAMSANVLIFFLLFFYTNVAGLPAGLASSVLAIGKIWDAINDPLTGILSDRTRTRWGRRIPWMVAGAIPFGICFYLQWQIPQFSPDPATNQWALFAYYVTIAIFFHLIYTAVNLPYTALTPELTEDYNERTALNSFRMAFSIGGSILSLVIAQVMFSLYPDDPLQRFQALGLLCSLIAVVATLWCALRMRERGADPILPTTWGRNLGYGLATLGAFGMTGGIVAILRGLLDWYALAGLLLGILLIAFGLTMIFNRPEAHLIGAVASEARSRSAAMPSLPILSQLKVVFNTRPFLYIIGIYLCSWLAVQLTASILIYFVVSWMGMPEEAFPMVAIAVQGTALAMLFVWRPISNRLGKKKVYYMGTAIWIVAQGGLSLLQPGQTGLMYGLAVLAGMGVSVAYLIPWSMVPDVIEYDELHSGQRREGLFYGFMVLLQKLGLAFAVFLVGQGLQLAGFIERLPSQPIPIQPDTALLAIRLVVGPLPIFVLCLGIVLTRFYPITKDYHQEIRQQLAAQRAQSALASQQ